MDGREQRPLFSKLPGHPFRFIKNHCLVPGGGGGWLAPRLTLVDGVLRQLAELAADYPRIGAQEFFLAGGQLRGESAVVRGASTCSPKGPT